jgi:hypothetical protein
MTPSVRNKYGGLKSKDKSGMNRVPFLIDYAKNFLQLLL